MAVTNFPDGVGNLAIPEQGPLANYFAPDPTRAHVFWDDFDKFNPSAAAVADWQVTLTNTTLATVIIADADGGVLQVTNTAADDDAAFFQWKGWSAATDVAETWKWAANKKMWFKARFKVSDATQSDLVIGLQITDTTPLAVTDGLYFLKADGSATLNFLATKNSTSTTVATATMANDTFLTVGFNWDSDLAKLNVFANDAPVGSITSTANIVDDEELAVSFGIQNGEAVAKVLSLDYIFVAKER